MKVEYITGTMWNKQEGTPQSEVIQNPSDFLPGDEYPRDHHPASTEIEERRRKGENCNIRFIPVPDFYRVPSRTISKRPRVVSQQTQKNH